MPTNIFADRFDPSFQNIRFAPIYKFFYVEFWSNKFRRGGTDLYMLYISAPEIQNLLDNCMVPYWPKTLSSYQGLNAKQYDEIASYPEAHPTSDLFANFTYNEKYSSNFRLWVIYDFIKIFKFLVENDTISTTCALASANQVSVRGGKLRLRKKKAKKMKIQI